MIRVLVVDDSSFMRTALSMMLEKSPDIRVVGTARDGQEALRTAHRQQRHQTKCAQRKADGYAGTKFQAECLLQVVGKRPPDSRCEQQADQSQQAREGSIVTPWGQGGQAESDGHDRGRHQEDHACAGQPFQQQEGDECEPEPHSLRQSPETGAVPGYHCRQQHRGERGGPHGQESGQRICPPG